VAFYNAVPVEAQGHFLWVPVQSQGARNEYPHELQVLDEASVQDFVALAHASSGTATLYNSLHAGASVNHIHFHSVHEGRTGPLIRAAVKAVGAHRLLWDYPATALVFDADPSCKRLWGVIDTLQRNDVPLNLIAVDKRVFVFPRNAHHEAVPEFPDGVIACAELSGKPITTRSEFFNNVTWEQLTEAFRKTCLSNEDILELLKNG
jgi:hypothetical protein